LNVHFPGSYRGGYRRRDSRPAFLKIRPFSITFPRNFQECPPPGFNGHSDCQSTQYESRSSVQRDVSGSLERFIAQRTAFLAERPGQMEPRTERSSSRAGGSFHGSEAESRRRTVHIERSEAVRDIRLTDPSTPLCYARGERLSTPHFATAKWEPNPRSTGRCCSPPLLRCIAERPPPAGDAGDVAASRLAQLP